LLVQHKDFLILVNEVKPWLYWRIIVFKYMHGVRVCAVRINSGVFLAFVIWRVLTC
jgi:hypothetical protein